MLKLGYSERDVHDAIDYVIGELSSSGKKEQEKPKKFKYISFSRIILPLIMLILLSISIFYNYNNISSISKDRCRIAELNFQIEQLNATENIDLVKKNVLPLQMNIWGIDRENFEKTRKALLANLPLDFLHINWLNPLFPMPCEKVSLTQSPNCRFYSDKQSYTCLKEHDDSFVPISTDYNNISGLALFINLIIILLEAFVLNSILVILWKLIKEHTTKKAKQVIEIIIILIIIVVITSIIYGIFQSLKAITS